MQNAKQSKRYNGNSELRGENIRLGRRLCSKRKRRTLRERKISLQASRPSPWRKRAKSVMFLRPEVVSRLSSLRRVAHSRTSPMISSLRCRNCLSNCEVRYSASTSLTGTTPTTHTGENNIKISPVRGLLAAMARLRSTETQKQKPQRMTCYTR